MKSETAHTPTPWVADIGDRLSDGSDCWVVDSDGGSIAEMMCPKDVEEANAAFIVEAVNNYDALKAKVERLSTALAHTKAVLAMVSDSGDVELPDDLLLSANEADEIALNALRFAQDLPEINVNEIRAALRSEGEQR